MVYNLTDPRYCTGDLETKLRVQIWPREFVCLDDYALVNPNRGLNFLVGGKHHDIYMKITHITRHMGMSCNLSEGYGKK